jgi:aldose 1-epimerase
MGINADPADAFAPRWIGSADGLRAAILPWGARLSALWVPSRRGPLNVVLGHATPQAWQNDAFYLGASIGRVSGRIAEAGYRHGGRQYRLTANQGRHHLHGGSGGLHRRTWQVLAHDTAPTPRLLLGTQCRDGEDGYPGQLQVTAEICVEAEALVMVYVARCDSDTPLSLTWHPYFNLSGDAATTVDDHRLQIHGNEVLALDREAIPTGARLAVAGTAFDFRTPARLGEQRALGHPQLELAGGHDHCYLLDPAAPLAAQLHHEGSGLTLHVATQGAPGLQLYTGQFLTPAAGSAWGPRSGLCLEPQHWPDAVNRPDWPSPVLPAGTLYRHEIRYRFT